MGLDGGDGRHVLVYIQPDAADHDAVVVVALRCFVPAVDLAVDVELGDGFAFALYVGVVFDVPGEVVDD